MSTNGTMRYRCGDARPVKVPLKSGVAVNIGDLCYEDAGDSYTCKPATSLAWASAVATPSAPTVADSGVAIGTSLTNAATGVKVSYQFPWGEGPLSNAGSATPTLHAAIKLNGVALPAPVIALNVYVETNAGSGTYKLWNQIAAVGGALGVGDVFITGYGEGQTPPGTPVSSGSLQVSQYNFVQSFLGVSAQYYDGSVLAIGIKDSLLRVDTAGEFDFPVLGTVSPNVGDYFGVDQNSTPNGLLAQQVVAVVHPTLAIGRCVISGTSLSTVRLQVFGSKFGLGR